MFRSGSNRNTQIRLLQKYPDLDPTKIPRSAPSKIPRSGSNQNTQIRIRHAGNEAVISSGKEVFFNL